ncbi:hypothetical protein MMYC01_202870 [Madurella mycetomatis]|uniref:Uncharacterized protein n=1 Tax=Madurella mycetomatis TaxID=100816 RepID=A0A175WAW0_9PEZI|nr:hypothetical protein MMYC01_202870 [Madurella mycetomatis]
MDLVFLLFALAGIFFLAVVEVMHELTAERQSVAVHLLLLIIIVSVANSLVHFFGFLPSCLPTVASKVNLAMESSVAGATRRLNRVRESVTDVAYRFLKTVRQSTPGGILSWVFRRLAVPLLLFALRPFVPVILRKYNLWKNWFEARGGDLVDWFCTDIEGRIERRRVLASLEWVYGVQLAELDRLNNKVAQVARDAKEAFNDNRYYLKGKYDFLGPTPFAGRIVAAKPEEGPLPKLGLWTRLRRRVDWDVFWADQKTLRIRGAIKENQNKISDLEHQLEFRSQEHWAIEDTVRICRRRSQLAWMNAVRAPRPEPEPEPEPYHHRPPQQIEAQINIGPWTGPASTILRGRAHNRRQHLLTTASQDAVLSSQTVDKPADRPAPTPSPLPLPLPTLPTADDILTAAAATPIPLTREEVALESAQQTLKQSHAVFTQQAEAMRRWKTDINQYAQDRVVGLKVIKKKMDAYGAAHSFWRQCSRLLYRQQKEEEKRKRATMEAEQGAPSAADNQRSARIKEAQEELRRAQEIRAAKEARLESAVAEEARLKALLDTAQAVRVALETKVESACAEETRLTELLEWLSVKEKAEDPELAKELELEAMFVEKRKEKAKKNLTEELSFEITFVEHVKEKAEQERSAEHPEPDVTYVEQVKENIGQSSLADEPELEVVRAEQEEEKTEQRLC